MPWKDLSEMKGKEQRKNVKLKANKAFKSYSHNQEKLLDKADQNGRNKKRTTAVR
jgi:hypothetical protein